MRISTVRLDILEIPFSAPLISATGRWEQRRVGLLRLETADGTEGFGEVASEAPGGVEAALVDTALVDRISTLLVGLEVADTAAFEARLGRIDETPLLGRPFRSAFESAVLDVHARAAASSIAATMASEPRREVRVNALLGIERPEASARTARRAVASGFECLKLKGGSEPRSATVERVAAVREAVGPRIGLRLDLNGSLDELAARDLLEALAPYALEYVEQPIAASSSVHAMARLRRGATVPLAADEAVLDARTARELIEADAVDALVLKPARLGGLTSAQRIAELGVDAHLPVIVSTLFETGIGIAGALHLAASLPGDHAHGLATSGLLAHDLLQASLAVARGRMAVPRGPGLGVRLDPRALRMYGTP